MDILDSGSLKIQYNRNRYYDYYSGRWLTHDPFGLEANAREPNVFGLIRQYIDGLNLYEYARENPLQYVDPNGRVSFLCIAQVAWAAEKSKGTNDKYRHCYVGCKISYYCGWVFCADAAILKELLDLVGMGTPELADLVVTFKGCGCGQLPWFLSCISCKCCCKKLGYSP